MADPVVHITAGIPDSGTGNITTLGQTLLDGANATLGAIADVAVVAGAAGTINAHLRSISRDIASGVVIAAGGNTIGNVGQAGAPWAQNVSQFGGAAVVTGTGIGGAGIPRVTVSSDSSIAAVQSGTWNITNITGTISLPTGAATSAKQPALGTAGVPSADVISIQGVVSGTAVPVSLSGNVTVVQPTAANLNATVTGTVAVSGTSSVKPDGTVWTLTGSSANVNVSGGTLSASQSGNWTTRMVGNVGAALDAVQNAAAPPNELVVGGVYNSVAPTITSGNASQLQLDVNGNLNVNIKAGGGAGGTSSSVGAAVPGSGTLALGSVTTAAPSYTTATANSLSLTTTGNLRVDGSSVTQPVSIAAAISVNPGTAANWGISPSTYNNAAPANAVLVEGQFLTSPGAMTSGNTSPLQIDANSNLRVNVMTSSTLTVTGAGGTFPVTGTFWQATQPVSIAAAVTVAQATAANLNATVTGSVNATLQASSATAIGTVNPTTPGNWGLSASTFNTAIAANGILAEAQYNSTQAAMTSGNGSPLQSDKVGRLLVNTSLRANRGRTKTSITTNTATTIIAAGGVNNFVDVFAFVVTNKSATAVTVDFNDGTAVVMTLAAPAGDTRGFTIPADSAIPQATANSAWTATVSAAVTSIEITALYVINL